MRSNYRLIILLPLLFLTVIASAQLESGWDQEKIMGKRYIVQERFDGSSFLVDDWIEGRVTLLSGNVISDIPIKYDGYHDELLSYNELYYSMILVEKSAIESFEFDYLGEKYYFELRFFDGLFDGDRFFQVYYDGDVDFLCFRQVQLVTCSPYRDVTNILKNQKYEPNNRFFLYDDENGYRPVSLKKKSLLRYVSKMQKKDAKQLLRSNNINLKTPESYARALKVFKDFHIEVNL